ncbi:FkbM family methyltransferase [Thermodesulfobacteriota bacterium]
MLLLLKSIIKDSIKRIKNFINDADYKQWTILERKYHLHPRFKELTLQIGEYKISTPDSASLLSAYKEIFLKKTYQFKTKKSKPYIIDVGANIGLSVLFFKKTFPSAEIIAIEADPHIFQYLQTNIHNNGFTDVELINKAAWHKETIIKFSSEGADAGRIAYDGDTNLVSVPAFDISSLLINRSVDMLKIDIEGAENNVLKACRAHLQNVDNIIVEYHSKVEEEQQLDSILALLRDTGFRFQIHSINSNPQPLVTTKIPYGFDLQLNIFAWRSS